MFKKLSTLIVIILAVAVCEAQAVQIASNWIGGPQGEWANASEWGDPCNWNPNVVPDNNENTFAVTIDSGTGQVIVGLKKSRTIDRLDCYGDIWLYMGGPNWIQLTLNEPDGLVNYGDFKLFIYGSQFDRIEGNITNHSVMELKSTIGYIKGDVTNASGAELILIHLWISGNLYNFTGGVIEIEQQVGVGMNGNSVENAGSIIVLPAGELVVDNTFHNTGQIHMNGGFCESDDLFHNDVNGVIKGFGVLAMEQLLENKGQLYAFGGSLAIACDGTITNTGTLGNLCLSSLHIKSAEDVNNQGTIVVNPGGGTAFDCNLVNEPNAILKLYGGTLALGTSTITQQRGATFEGFGEISGNVILEPNSIIKLTGPTNIVGDVNIEPNATLEISDGLTLVTGHTTCNGTIHMIGGWIIPQGGLSGDCNIIRESGLYTNVADFNIDGQVNFTDFTYFVDSWLWQTSWQ